MVRKEASFFEKHIEKIVLLVVCVVSACFCSFIMLFSVRAR